MLKSVRGSLPIKISELNLDLTLLGGQSFRWEKFGQHPNNEWRGVAHNVYWILKQTDDKINYEGYLRRNEMPNEKYYRNFLKQYLRLDFNLSKHIEEWIKAHEHFASIATEWKAVRLLKQEPFENIISFLCSQNNNIKRISMMIQKICQIYGDKIGTFNERDEYTFPSYENIVKDLPKLELVLREAKFGYRAKYITKTLEKIEERGGNIWFIELNKLSYNEARLELNKLTGIGLKVADCICLMSLDHFEAVPIDTHIFQIARKNYMPQLQDCKTVTPKIYEDIRKHFFNIYGPYVGWAQAILFCAQLPQFQTDETKKETKAKKRKK